MANVAIRRTAFAPTDIPNMVFHVSADSGVYADAGITSATDGQKAQQWNDASGQGNHVSQANVSVQPVYRATGLNGQPTLQFATAELDSQSFVDDSYSDAITLFWIGRVLNAKHLGLYVAAGGSYTGVTAVAYPGYANFLMTNMTGDQNNVYGYQNMGSDVVCVGISYDGTTLRTMLNGHYRSAARSVDLALGGIVRLGRYTLVPDGYISEAFLWKYGANATQMRAMSQYLLTRWGMSAPASPKIIVYLGDSMATFVNDATYAPNMLLQSMGYATASISSQGWSGYNIYSINNFAITYADLLHLETGQALRINYLQAGSNSIGAGAAIAYGSLVNYCAARRAAGWDKIIVSTVLPRTNEADPEDWEDRRQAYNALVRANWATFADGLCDIAADSRIGDAGDENDTDYYNADKVHPNAGGQAVIAELLEPILLSML